MMRLFFVCFAILLSLPGCLEEKHVQPDCPIVNEIAPNEIRTGSFIIIQGESFSDIDNCYKVVFPGGQIVNNVSALDSRNLEEIEVPAGAVSGPLRLEYNWRDLCEGGNNTVNFRHQYTIVNDESLGDPNSIIKSPNGISIDNISNNQADVYVLDADQEMARVYKIEESDVSNQTGIIEYFAGCQPGFACEGSENSNGAPLINARFSSPVDLEFARGFDEGRSLLILDRDNYQVRRIDLSTEKIFNFAGFQKNCNPPASSSVTCELGLFCILNSVSANDQGRVFVANRQSSIWTIEKSGMGVCDGLSDETRSESNRTMQSFSLPSPGFQSIDYSERDRCLYISSNGQIWRKCENREVELILETITINGDNIRPTDIAIDNQRDHLFFLQGSSKPVIGFIDLGIIENSQIFNISSLNIGPSDKLALHINRITFERVLYFTEDQSDRIRKIILI